jgi:hypothetical protein
MRPGDVSSAYVPGDTPAQVLKAYGFDQLNAAAANGAGQTIAIIDPYSDPAVLSDLNVFDSKFGIAGPPSFDVVNAHGGSNLPGENAGWAGEIATDVEWAHAIAPQAGILLVEAASDNTDDLMAAVNYARTIPSVSVVSISWGGGEFSGQTAYDSDFTTPTGHQGITYVVASGDEGAKGGAQWPASSPNVVSVGGTVLTIADQTGAYGSETSWYDSSGGISKFEKEPVWQQDVQSTGARSMPDVAYQADVNTGLTLYDSIKYQGVVGWQTTGGTSVGAPQWAALIAIADQARVAAGQTTLDGPRQTLPLLYGLYGAPDTAAYSGYTSYFHDITAPDDGQTRGDPTAGYDVATGLGTPEANLLIGALADAPSAATLAQSTNPAASPLTAAFVKSPPGGAIGGTAGALKLRVVNSAPTPFDGAVSIALDAAVDPGFSADPNMITTLSLANLSLASGHSKVINLNYTYPASLAAGNYYLVATLTTPRTTVPAMANSAGTVSIGPPVVKLAPAFVGASVLTIKTSGPTTASLLVRNLGNVSASGTLSFDLYDSPATTLSDSDPLLTTTPTRAIHLRPGASITIRVSIPAPSNLKPGNYYLIASIQSSLGLFSDVAVVGTRS